MDSKKFYTTQALLCIAHVANSTGSAKWNTVYAAKTLRGINIREAEKFVDDLLRRWDMVEMQLLEYCPETDWVFLHTQDDSYTVNDTYLYLQCEPYFRDLLEKKIRKLKANCKETK